jgi:gamma-glutamyl-gamma-aminobutyrate hydrolase PuuD
MIIILNGGGVQHLFSAFDDDIVLSRNKLPQDFKARPKFVVFTGGTDVNPKFYGEERLAITGYPDRRRDENEALWFSHCRANKIPMVGICRGSQFGCVMSGGALYQHVTGHGLAGTHAVVTDDGREFEVTSIK